MIHWSLLIIAKKTFGATVALTSAARHPYLSASPDFGMWFSTLNQSVSTCEP